MLRERSSESTWSPRCYFRSDMGFLVGTNYRGNRAPYNGRFGGGSMSNPRFLGYHVDTNRNVFLLSVASLSPAPAILELRSQHFTCFCAMDATASAAADLGKFCSSLLRSGCAYLCAWGPDCERVHDIMDELVVGEDPPQTYVGCVMTTWHANDSLKGALEYFLDCTVPDSDYAPNGCDWALIISVGSPAWDAMIEQYVATRTVSTSS